MEFKLPTPSPSREPKSETPATIDGAAEGHGYRTRMAAFRNLRTNEHSALRLHLNHFATRDAKSRITAPKDRLQMLLTKRDDKTQARVREGKGSQETTYPELFDKQKEDDWLKTNWRWYLACDEEDQDQDDEEPVPQVHESEDVGHGDGPMPPPKWQAKSTTSSYFYGSNGGNTGMSQGRTFGTRASIETKDEQPAGYETTNKPTVGIPCQRSYSIRFGYAGLHSAEDKVKAEAHASHNSATVGCAFTPSFARPDRMSNKRKAADEEPAGDGKRSRL
ncbi:hypothetical protein LTR08_003009 [Meristemomyces frigidus]|nr:hypothetical protein LTR08_003009 [Meristemomyces frigidus]